MLHLGHERQLFLDDFILAEMKGVTRTLHQPERYPRNPIVRGEHPWEDIRIMYPVVFRDGDLHRMYYLALGNLKYRPLGIGNFTPTGYAESRDGVNWEKPLMDYEPLPGCDRTNLAFSLRKPPLLQVEGPWVTRDENETDPGKRYKLFFSKGRDRVTPTEGFSVAFSPDGFRWTEYEGNPVYHLYGDTQNCVVWDPEIERWVAFVRRWGRPNFERPVWHWPKHNETRIRQAARMTSPDFIHWTPPEVILSPDPEDSHVCDFYGLQVTRYEGILIGFLWVLTSLGGDEPGSHGHLSAQLVVSRDHGLTWHRVGGRAPFMVRGPEGGYDGGGVYPVPFLTGEDRHLVYFTATSLEHGQPNNVSSFGLATLRRDGFVSLDGGEEPGEVITHPFAFSGSELRVNAEVFEGGSVEVSAEDARGEQLRGFGRPAVVTAGGTDVPARFEGGELRGLGSVRLRFRLHRASLYSFRLAG